jgi:hypothetical protein
MTPDPAGLLPTPPKKPNELIDRTNRILKLTLGKATGPLIGGNLTMIATLMGTPWQPDTTNAIVFLEGVHEEPYRIAHANHPRPRRDVRKSRRRHLRPLQPLRTKKAPASTKSYATV